jgi:hypothetical protein
VRFPDGFVELVESEVEEFAKPALILMAYSCFMWLDGFLYPLVSETGNRMLGAGNRMLTAGSRYPDTSKNLLSDIPVWDAAFCLSGSG